MKKLLFISSEGGHLQELRQLQSLQKDYDVVYVTERTQTTSSILKEEKHVHFLCYGTQDHLWSYLFIFPWNIVCSLFLFWVEKPDAIITTGTHTAVPMCYIAHLWKKKVIYIETLANRYSPTKAGKMVYPIADLFIVQWSEMLQIYPKAVYWGWLF